MISDQKDEVLEYTESKFAGKVVLYSFILSILSLVVNSCGNNYDPKFRQYYVQGERLYSQHCSNCHQQDGSGLGKLYPPLNRSDFMKSNFEEVICLIRFGTKGELIVNGEKFNQPMQGVSTLSDLDIAEIATYIYNTWDHTRGLVDVKDVSKILSDCPPAAQ